MRARCHTERCLRQRSPAHPCSHVTGVPRVALALRQWPLRSAALGPRHTPCKARVNSTAHESSCVGQRNRQHSASSCAPPRVRCAAEDVLLVGPAPRLSPARTCLVDVASVRHVLRTHTCEAFFFGHTSRLARRVSAELSDYRQKAVLGMQAETS